MNRRDFVTALREAERAREDASLSPFAERRIARAAEGGKRAAPTRWFLPLGVGAALAAASVALVVWVAGPKPLSTQPAVAFAEDGTATFERADAPLRDGELRVTVSGQVGAKIARAGAALRMVEGTAEFDVEKRREGEPPFTVFVSHGQIQVLGTRFTLVQRADGGEATLHEGLIRFVAEDGRTVDLSPGMRVTWPLERISVAPEVRLAPAELPASAPVGDVQRGERVEAPRPRPFDVESFIDDLNVLRRRGQFAEAAARLEKALVRPLPADTRERLSYELGAILTSQIRDTSRACAVWKRHRDAHPSGRYATEVARAEAALGCP
jgi:transmembrane sensor